MQGRNPSFEHAAKQRQARFRGTSPTISPGARTPDDDKGLRNPHLLAIGCEEENLYPSIRGPGGAVEFFHKRGIRWWKSARSGDGTSVDGPTRNMASSQVACVNFLLPLTGVPDALSAAIRALDADVTGVSNITFEGNTSPVEFEWTGLGGPLEGVGTRGANATSIDAFLVAETASGWRRAYLLEWKYTEQYLAARPRFKGRGSSGEARRRRYDGLFHAGYSSFNPEAAPELDEFLYAPFYQIMRQRLLADRMVYQGELGVGEAKVVVVVPEENLACRTVAVGENTTSPPLAQRFPHLPTVEEVMRAVLRSPGGQFDMVEPSTLLEAVTRALPADTRDWAGYWRERYGV